MFSGGKALPTPVDNLPAISEPIVWNVGFSTSHNPIGLDDLVEALLSAMYYDG
jgi:hypothetical protein